MRAAQVNQSEGKVMVHRRRRGWGGKGGGRGCGGWQGARVRQGGVPIGQLEAAHLLLAELFLHIPLEHLVKLLVLLRLHKLLDRGQQVGHGEREVLHGACGPKGPEQVLKRSGVRRVGNLPGKTGGYCAAAACGGRGHRSLQKKAAKGRSCAAASNAPSSAP